MKKKLLLLNLVLIAGIAGMGYELRRRWQEDRAREDAFLRRQIKPLPAPVAPPMEPVKPVPAAGYEDVAQKMLFTRDRNPNVVIEVAPPKPMPPLPSAFGFMNFGGPSVILTEKPGGPQRAYRPGEQIGAFKLVSVNEREIVFDWDGNKVPRPLDELIQQGRKQAGQTEASVAPAAPAPAGASTSVVAANAGSTAKGTPGADVGGGYRACQPGDTTPAGTVVDGMRKIIAQTPFGGSCRWEAVK